MKNSREAILACVLQHGTDDVGLISALQLLLAEQGKQAYVELFKILGDVDIKPELAEEEWHKVILHWEKLCGIIGRKIRLQTALCDYLSSEDSMLVTPKIIELERFEKILDLSRYDSLTGLLNRNYFDENLRLEVARSSRHGSELSLLFLDVDNFKAVNDTYGHLAGDVVLKEIAAIILQEKRAEDISTRFGGDEMALILPETGKEEGMVLAERIRHRVEKHIFRYREEAIRVTVSGGLTALSNIGINGQCFAGATDKALYKAKKAGKNRIVPYLSDQRKYPRIPFSKPLEIQCTANPSRRTLKAQGKNLSVGGIFVEITERIHTAEQVLLSLTLDKILSSKIAGTIVRVEETTTRRYGVGVSFEDFEKKISGKEIHRYVDMALRQLPAV